MLRVHRVKPERAKLPVRELGDSRADEVVEVERDGSVGDRFAPA